MSLEPKDKRMLIIGGVAALVIVLYAYVLSPLTSDLARKRDAIPKKEQDLVEMQGLRDQYREMQLRLKQAQDAASKRGPLLTEIENLTKRANLTRQDRVAQAAGGRAGRRGHGKHRRDQARQYNAL